MQYWPYILALAPGEFVFSRHFISYFSDSSLLRDVFSIEKTSPCGSAKLQTFRLLIFIFWFAFRAIISIEISFRRRAKLQDSSLCPTQLTHSTSFAWRHLLYKNTKRRLQKLNRIRPPPSPSIQEWGPARSSTSQPALRSRNQFCAASVAQPALRSQFCATSLEQPVLRSQRCSEWFFFYAGEIDKGETISSKENKDKRLIRQCKQTSTVAR